MAVIIGAGTLAIWIYLLFFRGGFWWLPYRPAAIAAKSSGKSVVAVVPARDEAETVGDAVASLLAQDYRDEFRVILVDDESGDGTAEAARAAAAGSDRLTICSGKPIPPGWTGKLWAVHQGIEAAQSFGPDYFLLTDADIIHGSDSLRKLVWRCEVQGYDLVSLMVRLHCRSLWETLLIPAFVFFFFKLYPPRWVADPSRRTAGAAGGCILIRAATLDRIGGVESIRGEIIDDCALARKVKSIGSIWLGAAQNTISIRKYRSWRAIWQMTARTAFAQLNYSAVLLALTVLMLTWTYLAPPLLVALASEPFAMWDGGLAWFGMVVAFLPTLRTYNAPRSVALLLPLIAAFYLAATVASAVLFWCGRGGYWKGRIQAPASDRT